jgi:diguanylate cyclase (GGDEF)-like protein/putative nucleotidyltransferase with HDIG domain
MNWKAKSYIAAVNTIGAVILASQLTQLHVSNPVRFLVLAAVTLLGSSLKVRLPGVTGTMSVYFLLVLIAITQLSLPEVLAAVAVASIFQCYWHAQKRPAWVQVCFNVEAWSLTVTATYAVFHWPILDDHNFGLIGRLVISSLVLFGANTVPIALVIALTEGKSAQRVWKESYFWSFPYYLMGATIAGGLTYLSRWLGWFTALGVLPVIYAIYHSYRLYMGKLQDEKEHAEQMASLHLRTIEALAMAIDAKDHTTHDHLQRVQVYAMEIGKELSLTEEETEALRAASLLHDIGKLAVPEHIISKPGRLTPDEFEKMKIHPVVGAEILERAQFPYPVAPIVRAHHEKWDGSGYPDGTKAEAIPIGARILSAVDCLDALASDRQYRRALPLDEAMKVVSSESGKAFDPKIVGILERRYREFEELSRTGKKVTQLGNLSTDMKVERGQAPDAGFEGSSAPLLDNGTGQKPEHFIESVAEAREEALDLFRLAQAPANSLRLSDTLSILATRIRRLVPYDSLVLYVIRDRVLVPEYVIGEDTRLFGSLTIPLGEGLSGWVADNDKPIVNGNPSVEPGYLNSPQAFSKLNSALAVPLKGSERVIGVLSLYHAGRDAYSRDHLRVLQAINSNLAMTVENMLELEPGKLAAAGDKGTTLPNVRSLFVRLHDELAGCINSRSRLGVLVCHIDGFSNISDQLGHASGKRLLGALSAELRANCRSYDHVAWAGGDEFALVMPGLTRESAQERMRELEKLVRQVSSSLCGEALISLVFGDAYFPEDGRSAEELMDVADRRMHQQKLARGRELPSPDLQLVN